VGLLAIVLREMTALETIVRHVETTKMHLAMEKLAMRIVRKVEKKCIVTVAQVAMEDHKIKKVVQSVTINRVHVVTIVPMANATTIATVQAAITITAVTTTKAKERHNVRPLLLLKNRCGGKSLHLLKSS
jgi:hypothetical protein